MTGSIRENFRRGIEQIRWFANVFSERVKIEIAVIRLLARSDELDRQRGEYLKKIGQRVCELSRYPDRQVLRDKEVRDAIEEIEKIEGHIEELKQKVSEISGAGA